ncbi:MAG: hypothetical protein ACHQX3_00040 [Nitrospirales bacterium]|jgi:hypothetical protein
MSKTAPKIKCRACRGSGAVDLNGPHLRTFNVLKRIGPATAAQVHSRLKENVDTTAINNRLRRMVGLKVVRLTNHDKPLFYEAV